MNLEFAPQTYGHSLKKMLFNRSLRVHWRVLNFQNSVLIGTTFDKHCYRTLHFKSMFKTLVKKRKKKKLNLEPILFVDLWEPLMVLCTAVQQSVCLSATT